MQRRALRLKQEIEMSVLKRLRMHEGADPESKPDYELLLAAKESTINAYAPYSKFRVGAAVRLKSGKIVTGVNFENAVFGLGICAEVNALGSVASAGELSSVLAIAVVGVSEINRVIDPTPPCGRCRQVISEAASKADIDIIVYFANDDLSNIKSAKISELLPHTFDARFL